MDTGEQSTVGNKTEGLIICGHRGMRVPGVKENTMEAIRAAIAAGADMIETDVRMTKDGKLVLRHDSLIPGTGKNTWELTADEIRAADPDIPLFAELLDFAAEEGKFLMDIEFKDMPAGHIRLGGLSSVNDDWAFTCADRICEEILRRGLEKRVYAISFSGRILEYVYGKYGKKFRYHGFYPRELMGEMETDPASFLDVACMVMTKRNEDGSYELVRGQVPPKAWYEELKSRGIVCQGPPSLRDPENYVKAIENGAEIIVVDDPAGMIQLLRKESV